MSGYKIATVSEQRVLFGEAPLWDHRDGKLYFLDCMDLKICSFDPLSKTIEKKKVNENAEYMIVAMPIQNEDKDKGKGFLVATSGSKLLEYDWETESVAKVVLDFESELKSRGIKNTLFSDGKCDAKGRFWIGSEQALDIGSLRVNPDKGCIHRVSCKSGERLELKTLTDGFDIPNGLAWNKQNDKLFYCDLLKRVVNVFDFDLNGGHLENRKTFFDLKNYESELGQGCPDGMTIDLNGNLYVAVWKAGAVIKIDGQTGKLVEKISIPVTNTTSVCFGDQGFTSLYVTTTSLELDKSKVNLDKEPDAGKLFRATHPKDNGFKGFEQNFFEF